MTEQIVERLLSTSQLWAIELRRALAIADPRIAERRVGEIDQRGGEIVRVAQAILRAFRQEPQDEILQRGGHTVDDARGRDRRYREMSFQDVGVVLAAERWRAGHRLVEHATDRVEIG